MRVAQDNPLNASFCHFEVKRKRQRKVRVEVTDGVFGGARWWWVSGDRRVHWMEQSTEHLTEHLMSQSEDGGKRRRPTLRFQLYQTYKDG